MAVRVRFAPSPTGYLHIGGARTALYNFLLARHEGGTFILRVEDTDQARSTLESIQTILDGLRWLKLTFDEGPFFQSERLDAYRKAARRLETSGRAYWREDPGKGKALVFRIDRAPIGWDDLVLGPLSRDTSGDPDLVIVKSDGFPTYNFACVVDDADMRISHVLRGQEHIPNTPKQVSLYRAFGWEPPKFGHLPLIFDPKGEKISKRKTYDFPVTIEETQAMGYLPEAFVNFLALLGWSPGGDLEIMSLDEMVQKFTLDRVNASPARFLREKLEWMNGLYVRRTPPERVVELCRPFLEKAYDLGRFAPEKVAAAVLQQQERLKTLRDVVPLTRFFFAPVEYDPAAVDRWLRDGGTDVLRECRGGLAEAPDYGRETIESLLKGIAERRGVKLTNVAQPLRVALTGTTVSPPIHDVVALLGREAVLERIDRALALVERR